MIANLGGPSQDKRALMALISSVIGSKLQHTAPIWVERGVDAARNRPHRLAKIVRIAKFYRSVSFKASMELAGTPVTDLFVIERSRVATRLEAFSNPPISATTIRRKERVATMNKRHRRRKRKEYGRRSCYRTL